MPTTLIRPSGLIVQENRSAVFKHQSQVILLKSHVRTEQCIHYDLEISYITPDRACIEPTLAKYLARVVNYNR